jgi:hypothetical protein
MLQSSFIHGIKRMPCAWSTVNDVLKYVAMELAEGKLPDGVDGDGQARPVGAQDVLAQLGRGRDEDAGAVRFIDERLEHLGGAGT